MTASHVIQLDNISYKINGQIILSNISQQVQTNSITTLIGPSGSGKTTLLKLCNALISPTNGQIFVEGQAIDTFEPTVLRRKVGIVLQQAPILRTTVFENLALPRRLQHQTLTTEEALNALIDVGLDESFLMRQATDLSGGQKQKIAIARTLLNNSTILLLDEITSALDPQSVHDIEQLILKLRQRGVTIIWITHSTRQAKDLGDMTWVLMKGELVAAGTTNEIMSSKDSRIQSFLLGRTP
ncbi:ABC transporter ATP-binding protein [Bacillus ndiopicus]|uniref:ABC transporter ATP-binding protein n=1 Tax=Bacillus ndiopicus TaxID=1347368 RepID=UPI0005A81066|nr:ATP-binding cassette domain-containing protein [Bacillus ndiopicus]